MKARTDFPIETLRAFLGYDPISGVVTWLRDRSGPQKAGTRAGRLRKDGYREITLLGHAFLEHRVAWALTHGRWPELDIDHRDRDRSNNPLANLREATRSNNKRNSACKGFHKRKDTGRYTVKITTAPYKSVHVGVYDTEEDARTAYLEATRKHYGEFSVQHG